MPRVTYLQTNFTAGELSPRLYGRVDVDRYQNAAKRMTNAQVLVQGGARRRLGTQYLGVTKDSTKISRLIPFVATRSLAFVLEFGDLYMRVWKTDGTQLESAPAVPYEIATPYTQSMLFQLDFAQGADTMFIYHVDVPTQRLQRLADGNWQMAAAEFLQLPTDEIGHRFESIALTLSVATVGVGRTATAGAAAFLVTDVGRQIVSGGGVAKITAFSSSTVVTVEITKAFASASIAAGEWLIEGSPNGFAKPFEKNGEPTEGKRITIGGGPITGTDPTVANSTASWAAGVATMNTGAAHGYATGEWVLVDAVAPDGYNGVFQVTVTGATSYTYALTDDPQSTGAGGTSARLAGGSAISNLWRAQDVGSIVRINGGYARVLTVHNPVSARVLVLASMTGESLAAPGGWSLEQPVWSARYGYPRTGTFYEQRHVVAGSKLYPTTVWGSRVGEPLNFEVGVEDDRGFAFAIASDERNPIAFVAAGRTLIALSYGSEFTLNGGIERPIAPTNVQIRARSNHGCAEVRPLTIGSEQVFVQRAGRKLRAFTYNVTNDDFEAPDISVLAEHVTAPRLIDLAWQRSPEPWLWALREDGRLLCCTYDRVEQQVIAWTVLETKGAENDNFESVTVIPDELGNEAAWVIVRREVDGVDLRYVERFSEFFPVDCGLTLTSLTAETIWPGLDHLEGRIVDVVADGAYAGQYTVELGAITLTDAANVVTIGLPYTMSIELLDPELQGGAGSAVGNSMRTGEITLRLLNSIGGTINGQKIPTRFLGPAALNTPPVAVSGLFRIENLGWARGESPVVIEQPLPLAFTLLGVARKFSVND